MVEIEVGLKGGLLGSGTVSNQCRWFEICRRRLRRRVGPGLKTRDTKRDGTG